MRTPHRSSTARIIHQKHNYRITLLWIQFTDRLRTKSLVDGTEIQNDLENWLKVSCGGTRRSTHRRNRKTVKFADESAGVEGDRGLQEMSKLLRTRVEDLLRSVAKLPRALRPAAKDFNEHRKVQPTRFPTLLRGRKPVGR